MTLTHVHGGWQFYVPDNAAGVVLLILLIVFFIALVAVAKLLSVRRRVY